MVALLNVGCFLRLPPRYCLVSYIWLIKINIEVSLFRVYSRNNNIGLWNSVGTDFKF